MSEIPEIAKKVAEKIVEKVSDIDLILLYGSIAQGRGHERDEVMVVDDGEPAALHVSQYPSRDLHLRNLPRDPIPLHVAHLRAI